MIKKFKHWYAVASGNFLDGTDKSLREAIKSAKLFYIIMFVVGIAGSIAIIIYALISQSS